MVRVGREGTVEVYPDLRTGRHVYVGRSMRREPPDTA